MANNSFLSLITGGLAANRPATPDPLLPSDLVYLASDTGVLSFWNGTAWVVLASTGVQAGVTAATTQTLVAATQLNGGFATLTTVANVGDSVKLPAAPQVGQETTVINNGASNAWVYPGEAATTIDGGSAGAKVVLTAAFGVTFICTAAGAWTSTGRSAKSS